MSPRILIPILVVAAACGVTAFFLNRGSTPPPPPIRRIVLVTIDTLRADALPMYGNPRVDAPTLSRLAREGVVFDDAIAPSPWTRPSVASMLTGLPPKVHGFCARGFDKQASYNTGVRTIAELFTDAGFQTAAFGYNPFLANSANLRRGFRDFVFYPPMTLEKHPRYNPSKFPDALTSTEVISELARAWSKDHADSPSFLWVHYYDPHYPYTPPQEYFRYPEPTDKPDSPREGDAPREEKAYQKWAFQMNHKVERTLVALRDIERVAVGTPPMDKKRTPAPLGPRDEPELRALYEGEVRLVDRYLGELIADLEQRGQLDETLIVVTSDHGEEFWEHDGLEHGHTLYQELVRVPLIVRGPGIGAGVRVRERVTLMNVLPTLLELAGLAPAAHAVAPSLAETLRHGTPPEPPVDLVVEHTLYGEPERAVMFGRFKYIYSPIGRREQLFDLEADPDETVDLAAERPDDCARARAALKTYDTWAAEMRKLLKIQRDDADATSEAARKLLRDHGYLK